jgi:SAM-dependent methyltransferase
MSDPLRAKAPEIFAVVFCTGAAVMMVEILGTRLIGPVFGIGLFVWAALLTITLSSLAVGYYTGGVLADRFPTPLLLGVEVGASGIFLGIVPFLSHAVLRLAEGAGARVGPLVSATLLFAPCLAALGMIGPIAVRLAMSDLRAAGHRVGAVYAVSTAGSVVGTLATAFALVPSFETSQILFGISTSLVVIGIGVLARRGKPAAAAAIGLPVVAWALMPRATNPAGFTIVDRAQSPYGLVEVIDDSRRDVRLLRAEHSIIGAEWKRDHTSGFSFTHLLEAVRFLRPSATNVLQIGLGSGALPSVLARRGLVSDVVEIDPAVVRFATNYFGFSTSGRTYTEDARSFLARSASRYDIVVHDTFTGGTTPEHLLSLEALREVHDLLRPGGLLALNFAGYEDGAKATPSRAVLRTLKTVFPNVRVFRDMPPNEEPDAAANLVYFASDGSLDVEIPKDAWFESAACRHILQSFAGWEVHLSDGELITDARNPLGQMQIPVFEEHFEDMRKMLPLEVWLQ